MDSSGSVRCRRQPTESVEREDCSPSLESVHAISVCSAWLMSISHALTDLSDRSDSIAGEAAPDFLSTTMKGSIAKKIRKYSFRRWHQWCLNFRCNLQVCCKSLPKCERQSLPQLLHVLWFIVLTLVGQRMAIRLMRLDGDDSRAQYIEVYLSVY